MRQPPDFTPQEEKNAFSFWDEVPDAPGDPNRMFSFSLP
ncbi:hypothetical protein L499_A3480 [Bordetella holmesii CDC-H635-BH]|uniref:Uncharacterized protein n=2 Tax=Bordetella holmesii TaxID=35814 RepID=A0A158M8B1_9BORD|nr:hypothetical protein D556_1842 [Bordetella holmesii 41130]EWM47073.1 hypothetical protein D555_1856 [Bordetella holmesii 35009]EXX96300.1 hypothetical protein D559_3746 [Bordetella holmesii 1058]KAK80733.1 hypothetical protein L496_3455 [Bordetella holmesii CDC-H572-BH]KAK84600.1 hypothetical protein L503_3503 [Bordetella holmesii CDC-H809-BH]KAK87951.1 hypothetical protein L573_2768 [Bordetella holmesii H620]KAK89330.1 hypothetical protein L499_A3480 [Bordetella holmesii CDC-H635-BH]KAK9